jgi:hypothetical protein
MKNLVIHSPLDLIEVRRQLIAMRSFHANDRRVTDAINRLIGKLAHLHAPENRRHEEQILKAIAKTIQRVNDILAQQPENICEFGSRNNP